MCGLLAALSVNAQSADALKVKSCKLDNGLEVWLNEDPNQIGIYGAVVVKAGAVDCPGTGIAHYFEHMMFKGTDKIGTIDYEAEKPYLDSIAAAYDRLALAEGEDAKKEIQLEINRLSVKAADYAIPNEFNSLISEMGGTGLNAFTSYDETVYHNLFLPEYFEQWAELNSERIINPVFRLFQSELETVYEEKNRSDDGLMNNFRDIMLANIYEGTSYVEPIIGTTENLKNPRLSQMREFFEKYYVASNMGLVLTGNFKAEEVMPVIERTFGRIRKGDPIEPQEFNLAPLNGRKDVTALINMPLVKVGAFCFRGPAKNDPDYNAVNFLTSLLNNEAGTGLFDRMMVNHEIMEAEAMPDLSFKNAGSLLVLYIPKLVGQSDKAAAKKIMKVFDRIKAGDFDDDFFESCKNSFKKTLLMGLEDQASRMQEMAFALSDGIAWDDILARADEVDSMTKDDIVAIANKYLTDDYILIHKKKGEAARDALQKPEYEKVTPKNKEAASAYAQALRKSAEGIEIAPRALDYDNDATITKLAPMVTLYSVENPYNDIFDLSIYFNVGVKEKPALEHLSAYVNLLGTEDKSFDDIHTELQKVGGSVRFASTSDSFVINMDGFDSNLGEITDIVADLLSNIKGDAKKLKQLKTEEKAGLIMSRSDMDALSEALFEKVYLGDNSPYTVDKGEFSDDFLLGLFEDLQKVECDVTYSGNLPAEVVAEAVRKCFDVDAVTVASNSPVDFAPVKYDGPQVFFLNKANASQSQIYSLIVTDPVPDQYQRYFSNVYMAYLGGGMSSLLFQEIREFRSMAYSTYASLDRPVFKHTTEIPSALYTFVGTQYDKTLEAMDVVDSLVMHTPFLDNKIASVKKEMMNSRCNAFPDFRSIAANIISSKRDGYEIDPVADFIKVNEDADAETLREFWEKYIVGRNTVWCVVGNSKKLDITTLEKYGPVTTLTAADVIK